MKTGGMTMVEMTKETIMNKLNELEVVKIKLKEDFIGIDDAIDQFIESIKVWHVAPELQLRPLIVNLWGMTGVGKTELVRKFVKLINFQENYVEVEMNTLKKGILPSYSDTRLGAVDGIQFQLESNLNGDGYGILLLDEIQKFRTIDGYGNEIPSNNLNGYSDIWTLLGDGKFTPNLAIKETINSYLHSIKKKFDLKKRDNSPIVGADFYYDYVTAKRIKYAFGLKSSIDEIMTLDSEKILTDLMDAQKNPKTYENKTYSKLLIIISGNLDEAFEMSKETDDIDVDADILYEHSRKITLINIKRALRSRFRPEQIARFGNNHIIYPSLSRDSYNKIIRSKCDTIVSNIKEITNISITLDDEIYDIIYRNGVFPSQGVRPVLSTISSTIETSMPFFIYNCMLYNVNNIHISYKDGQLCSNISGNKVTYKIATVIDNIKNSKNIDIESLVAIHEVGHTIAYISLMKLVPKQLVCTTASLITNGFIMTHETFDSKEMLKNKIIIALSGQVAEEVIFGENMKTTGSASDISIATSYASSYVRKYGMDGFVGDIICGANANNLSYGIVDYENSNDSINVILNECKIEATNILNKNLSLMKKLTIKLLDKKVMKDIEIAEIVKEYYPDLNTGKFSHTISENYNKMLKDKFLSIS